MGSTLTNRIFCLFEGKTETKYFDNLKQFFFEQDTIIVCSYNNDVYELYRDIKEDDDLDIIEIIRESNSNPNNRAILKNYSRTSFTQVFLFFDHDMQDTLYQSEDFIELHDMFNDETEHGKIFVSYPMVEAIRHQPSTDQHSLDFRIDTDKLNTYKSISAVSGQKVSRFNDIKKITRQDWEGLVGIHVMRAYWIETGQQTGLTHDTILDLKKVAEKQVELSSDDQQLIVLSAFPLFLFHYMPSSFNIS